MSQKHMVTEEFIEGMMGEISTAMIPYQQLFSSSYREFMRYYPSFLPKFESHNSYPVVVDAFIDYDELISNYYFAQGFLGAAGGLLGQVNQLACILFHMNLGKADGKRCAVFID